MNALDCRRDLAGRRSVRPTKLSQKASRRAFPQRGFLFSSGPSAIVVGHEASFPIDLGESGPGDDCYIDPARVSSK